MSTNACATDINSLDSKTETLAIEPSSGSGVIVQDLVDVDDARVSRGELGVVVDKDELIDGVRVSGGELGVVVDEGVKVLDESRSDAAVSSVPVSASDEVKIGDELTESKSGVLITKTSDRDGEDDSKDSIDDVRVSKVQDLVDEARVSGDKGEKCLDESRSDVVVSSGPVAASDEVKIGDEDDSLDSKTETLATEPSSGGITVQDLVDEVGIAMNKGEKGLDESRSDAVVSSVPVAASDEVKIGDELLDSKTETLATESSSGVVQDLVDDVRVSGGEIGVVMDNDEKVLDESRSDVVVLSVPPAASEEVKIGADLLESKSGTLIMETSGHDGGGDIDHIGVGDIVVQGSVDGSMASRDDKEIVMKNVEKVSVENEVNEEEKEGECKVVQDSVNDTRVSVDETGIVKDNSEPVLDKSIADAVVSSETLKMNPSADHNEDGVVVNQGSIDDKRIVTENIDKVSDENEVNIEEKDGEYKVTDIVWAKVKNYPWWPAQIFDPSSSTDKAKKYSNKKGLLVGYFGDQSFAWNKPSNIKPFRKNFCKLEKQSNSIPFLHAVDCALDEVSRRVDFGLACSCLSKEVYDEIKSQEFVNAGITKEASRIDGGDRFSTVSSFKPVKVVQSVQELAKEQFDGFDRLEVLSVRTQLLAFFRWKGWKGCYQFQALNFLDELDNKLEDKSEVPLTEENKVVEDEKPASVGKKVKSKKRKSDVSDSDDSEDSVPHKKERSLTNVTPKGNSSAKRSKKNSSTKTTVEDNVIKEKNGKEKTASAGKKVSSKKPKPDVYDSDDSDDSVPHKKERSLANMTQKGNSSVKRSKKDISKKEIVKDNVIKEENVDENTASGGKKVSSKKRKSDVCDSDDSEDSVPRKKEKSLTKMTSKGNSSVKRSKQSISKKATVEDNGGEKPVSGGKKVSSKKPKPDVSDSDDSEDSVPRKKEKSLANVISKGNSSVKRSKESIIKKETVKDNGNEKKVSSKKQKADVSDSDDCEDLVPRKKEKSVANVTPKGDSSVKRIKQGISKKATVEDHGNEKPVSGGKKVSSKKRKPDVSDSDDSVLRKKERSLTNKASKVDSSVKRSEKNISKKATSEDNASEEDNGNGTSDKKSSNSSPKRLFRVGDSICRIAKQISESPSILKNESQKLKNDDDEESS
ncbi:uncharacterized protein LOC143606962 [Bidens hawaiensis]|uniref:uncharacterized protein LOC143606962 n=1 Tax=Bidens hawaiensis TaxID=980011 RepID=UPI00404B7253